MARRATPRQQGAAEGKKGHGALSEVERTNVLVALLRHGSVVEAAEETGVGERTIYRWLAEDVAFKGEFEAALKEIRDSGVDEAKADRRIGRAALRRLAKTGDVNAARELYKAGEPIKLEHTGAKGGPIEVSSRSDSDLEREAAEILKRKGGDGGE